MQRPVLKSWGSSSFLVASPACRTSITAKNRDGLWKAKWSPGCFSDVCAIHHTKKKGIKLSVNTTAGSLYNLLKYKNLTTLLYRITQVNTPLKQNLQAEFSTAELGHWNQAGVSLQTKDDKRLTPLLSASTLRHIWKRTITEPAQLCTVTHLLSIRNEEFHLSPCHAVFCIYIRSLSSKPWFDLTSLT